MAQQSSKVLIVNLYTDYSGPKRYDFESGEWVYQRDNSTMKALLEKELSIIFSQDISLPILPND
jgi:frataxin-like iron-binding protein CyaY